MMSPIDIITPIHPVVEKIKKQLESHSFEYEYFSHDPVRTSLEASQVRTGYSLKQGTKALIVRAKKAHSTKDFCMIVVSGDKKFDTALLRLHFGLRDIRFADPEEVSKITDGVLPGGVPPWGNLFGLSVYIDDQITLQEKIIFNAGDKRVSIGMFTKDYIAIVQPSIGKITQ